ncbi:hypothetical protein GQ42DRAFT_73654 [Ramicandelaber brevisporus]|nr:hypothetical protein GQ42DRAFT_73654 [Ramicandelaber brevisporus]
MPEMSTRMQELGGGATGQLFSIFNVFWAGGIILGPLIAGVLVDAIGYRKAMLVIFGILAATSIVVAQLPIRRHLAAKKAAAAATAAAATAQSAALSTATRSEQAAADAEKTPSVRSAEQKHDN